MSSLRLLLPAVLTLCGACADDADKPPGGGADSLRCTLIGCGSNLTLTIKGAAGAAVKKYHGSATLEGSSGTFSCTGAGGTSKGPCGCGLDGVLSCTALKGGDLTLEVFSDEAKETFKGVVKPAYTVTYPNGPACPPKCYKADEAVTLKAY